MTSPWYEAATRPRSIAVIGASSNPAKNHHQQQLAIYGFEGQVYPVHPRESTIGGIPAYRSIRDVPGPVDVAMIALPAEAAEAAVEDCVAAGVRLVYVFASGFSETGAEGREREERIRKVLAGGGGRTRMMGPNGTGILSVRAKAVATPLGARQARVEAMRDDGVAIVSQSGLISSAAFIRSQSEFPAIGTSFAIGNECDLGLADAIESMLDDQEVSVILAYVEGLRDPERFLRAARRARAIGKPIVVLKGGATSAGAAAAASHTASLSGGDHVLSGVLAQAGVRRVASMSQMLDVARILKAQPAFDGRRATIFTSSGGLGIMATDQLVASGFSLAPWERQLTERLRKTLPAFVTIGNPLDGAGDFAWGRPPLEAGLRAADENPATDFIVVTLGGMPDAEVPVAAELRRIISEIRKPVFVAWVGGLGTALRELNKSGIPAFDDLRSLAEALSVARVSVSGPDAARAADDHAIEKLGHEVRRLLAAAGNATSLDEVASKALLKAAGIPVVEEVGARDESSAVAAAVSLGYPVVLKLRAPGLLHKSELDAVSLNVVNESAVRREAARLLAIADRQRLQGADVVVQRHVPPGVELLLGMHRDATFGRVITLGIGGVLTEALADAQCFLPDASQGEFANAFAGLRHQKLLSGYRHLASTSAEQLWPIVSRFAALVRVLPETVSEIDVNPLIVDAGSRGAVAVDALVMLSHPEA